MEIAKTSPDYSVRNGPVLDDFIRRLFDIVSSAIGLLLLSPFFVLIAAAIKRDSPGPVFYRGPRTGKNGVKFGIIKFRTMYERPESYRGPKVTANGDTRITPLGKWLRDTKINELPQLWNVLIGDMSLVGPRPEDPDLATTWPRNFREVLLSVRPGITSPATVVYRGEENMLQSSNVMDDYLLKILPDKLRLDLLYIRNRNILTDLDVLLMTVVMLLPYIKRIEVPNSFLYWGPVARFTSRFLSWFIIDTVTASLAIGFAGLIWRMDSPLNYGPLPFAILSLVMGTCFSLINYFIGLQRIVWRRAPSTEVIPLVVSAIFSTILLELAYHGIASSESVIRLNIPDVPTGLIVTAGMLAFFGFVITRYRDRLLTGLASRWLTLRGTRQMVGERVLLVGAGNNSSFATWLLTRREFSKAFCIIGMVDDDPRKQGMTFEGISMLGTTRDIPDLVKKKDVGLIVYTINNIVVEDQERILGFCRSTNCPVVMLPEIMDEIVARFQIVKGIGS